MKVAIVHDWLVTYGGAERVLEQMVECFPEADLFSLIDFLPDRDFIKGKHAKTSFIQRLPMAKSRYRGYLMLFPMAIEQLDLSAYDLVISSSYAVAKGVLTGPDQLHVSYVHSPIRYAWDMQNQYLKESKLESGVKSILARSILHYIRMWDTRTADGVDQFLSNSAFIGRRIAKVYHRESTVVYPPVDLDGFSVMENKDDFYVTVSRMVSYKRMDLIVQAFNATPWRSLVVIGDGPEMARLKAMAGPNIVLLGHQPFEVLRDHLQRARAFVFAAEEDFGISVVEAQACGTPVIAYGKGGALETVRGEDQECPTGVFFGEQTEASLQGALARFERQATRFTAGNCRANAERFSKAQFRQSFMTAVTRAIAAKADSRCGVIDSRVDGRSASSDVVHELPREAPETALVS
ncbi:Glycosyltransferase involved in cell wall bisynthesis [Chitinasiproducens palmae]|uniref:Glycosyltransferase involved in cell wall bisynthesis n=1 Tax=Chitinasiproducens palmae TaxID=1770053 RepID=A0A1H2PUU2_9BURK|nr:glycosyltransferase family 4 protein [Chitinasiproducens palmae]SDV50561.1 Glycosyltransferase involved in cell wall bisynthesis [Chitinasiproducens palmae]